MTKRSFLKFLESKTAKWPRRYIRYLFGSAGFFFGPRLFAFLMEDSFGIKVPESDRKKLLKSGGVGQFFNGGKPFGRWLEVPFPKTKKKADYLVPFFRKAYLLARKSAG